MSSDIVCRTQSESLTECVTPYISDVCDLIYLLLESFSFRRSSQQQVLSQRAYTMAAIQMEFPHQDTVSSGELGDPCYPVRLLLSTLIGWSAYSGSFSYRDNKNNINLVQYSWPSTIRQ